jgi:hypothetical protein
MANFTFQKVEQPISSEGKEVFHKNPLGRRWHLISKPAGSGICEFSVRYVWNEAKARLRWNTSLPQRPLFHFPNPYLSKQTYKTLL